MNAVEIYEKASWDLEHSKITLGEFEERIKPLYDVEPVRHGRWMKHFLVADLVCSLIYLKTKGKLFKWLYHDIYHWHILDETMGFDGLSFTSHCKICGKKIMQDSQGNWF